MHMKQPILHLMFLSYLKTIFSRWKVKSCTITSSALPRRCHSSPLWNQTSRHTGQDGSIRSASQVFSSRQSAWEKWPQHKTATVEGSKGEIEFPPLSGFFIKSFWHILHSFPISCNGTSADNGNGLSANLLVLAGVWIPPDMLPEK